MNVANLHGTSSSTCHQNRRPGDPATPVPRTALCRLLRVRVGVGEDLDCLAAQRRREGGGPVRHPLSTARLSRTGPCPLPGPPHAARHALAWHLHRTKTESEVRSRGYCSRAALHVFAFSGYVLHVVTDFCGGFSKLAGFEQGGSVWKILDRHSTARPRILPSPGQIDIAQVGSKYTWKFQTPRSPTIAFHRRSSEDAEASLCHLFSRPRLVGILSSAFCV